MKADLILARGHIRTLGRSGLAVHTHLAIAGSLVVAVGGAEVMRLVKEGFVRPVVGARFPLEQAAEALKLIDERGAVGKIVLDVS